MPDLAKKYTKQLAESDNKPFVLSRMITEFCMIALPLKLVIRLYKLFGEYTIYNAVFATAGWVEREHIREQEALYRYLYAVCKNMHNEERNETGQQGALQRSTADAQDTKETIREIYARKRAAVGQ